MTLKHPFLVSMALAAVATSPALAIPPAPDVPPGPTTPSAPAFGAATRVENMAVYPITMATQEDLGPVISLEEALAKGTAEVREVGGDNDAQPRERQVPRQRGHRTPNLRNTDNNTNNNDDEQLQVQSNSGGGATVNTLVIENKGDVPVFVLAGTVVKGGKQDRQIGQDFVVDAKKTVPVDAFCVERGRWDGNRNGLSTSGKFEAAQTLATSKVRAAGQHKKNQGEVWSEVSVANKAHAKEASSDTLLATLDDKEIAGRTEALAKQIEAVLAAGPKGQVVGFAYAIDGKVRGARWFASSALFELYRSKLVRTAAVDALTAEAVAKAQKSATFAGTWPEGKDVATFIADIEQQAVKELRDTEADNMNEYKESDRAYGAKTVLKGKADAKPKPISYDFIAK